MIQATKADEEALKLKAEAEEAAEQKRLADEAAAVNADCESLDLNECREQCHSLY